MVKVTSAERKLLGWIVRNPGVELHSLVPRNRPVVQALVNKGLVVAGEPTPRTETVHVPGPFWRTETRTVTSWALHATELGRGAA